MCIRIRAQVAEATGSLNRWYCSQAYGQQIDSEELLLTYYIKNGGAKSFATRYAEAMDATNRWYCSQYYGREICDPEILWNYYASYAGCHGARSGSGFFSH
jgi:hypothetical protein